MYSQGQQGRSFGGNQYMRFSGNAPTENASSYPEMPSAPSYSYPEMNVNSSTYTGMGSGPSGFPYVQSKSNYFGSGFAANDGGMFTQANIKPEVQQLFHQVDTDHSGRINSTKLQAALVNNQGKHYSEISCKLMIAIFDRNYIGSVDIYEFQQLYDFINYWIVMFRQFDRDQSGTIEYPELAHALQYMNYRFSQQFIGFLMNKFDFERHSRITIDQFIVMCIQIKCLTDLFIQRDTQRTGAISVGYEEFLFLALQCSP